MKTKKPKVRFDRILILVVAAVLLVSVPVMIFSKKPKSVETYSTSEKAMASAIEGKLQRKYNLNFKVYEFGETVEPDVILAYAYSEKDPEIQFKVNYNEETKMIADEFATKIQASKLAKDIVATFKTKKLDVQAFVEFQGFVGAEGNTDANLSVLDYLLSTQPATIAVRLVLGESDLTPEKVTIQLLDAVTKISESYQSPAMSYKISVLPEKEFKTAQDLFATLDLADVNLMHYNPTSTFTMNIAEGVVDLDSLELSELLK